MGDKTKTELDRLGLGAVLDSLFSFIGIFSVDGTFIEVNKTPLELAGLSRDDVIGQPIWDTFWLSHSVEQQDIVRAAFRQAAKGEIARYDLTVKLSGDGLAALDCRLVPLLDDTGEVTAIVGSGVDVSDRVTILDELKRERDFAKNLLDTAPVITLLLDMDGKIVHVNSHFEQLTGYTLDEIKNKDWFSTFLPERDRADIRDLFREASSGTQTRGNVNAIVTRSGAEIEIEWHDQIIRDDAGRPVSLLAVGQDVTERLKAQEAIATSATRLNEAQRIARIGSWELDLIAGTLHWSQEIYRIFELDAAHFKPSYDAFLNAIHPDDRDLVNEAYSRSLEDRSPYEITHRLQMDDGRIKYVQERCETTFAEDGSALKSTGTVQDITGRHLAEIAREQAEKRSGELVEQLKSTVEIMERRDREILLLNQMLESLMSCDRAGDALDIVHQFSQRIFDDRSGAIAIHAELGNEDLKGIRWWGAARDDVDILAAMKYCRGPGTDPCAVDETPDINGPQPDPSRKGLACVPLISNGRVFGLLVVRQRHEELPLRIGSEREMAVAVAEGLSLALSNVEMRGRLYAESTRDPLTKIYNRRFFLETVRDAMQRSTGDGARYAVHVLDLDDFKAVNDRFGHPSGDSLIEMVAKRLTGAVRKGDTVARLGGDEFAILETLDRPGQQDAVNLAARILDSISQPFTLSGHQVTIGVSIGIVLAPDHGADADVLLRSADLALYKVKSEGRRGFRFFEPEMDEEVRLRRALEADLLAALPEKRLELHYQPIVDARTRQPVSLEALVRWRHPTDGLLLPDRFISIAEETGLIVPIGRWVLRKACVDASRWPEHIKVAVNLSAVQFRTDDIVDMVVAALADSGLEPHRLELEITETVLLQKYDWDLGLLNKLRDLGISVVLDDFGTGYSSLRYLKEFHFAKIKIDKSFVAEVSDNADSGAIVCAVAGLGRNMGIDTTAEGIETEEQFRLLQAAGCTQMQGYLFGRPQPISDLDIETTEPRPRPADGGQTVSL